MSERLLIVEDEIPFRRAVARYFRSRGFDVAEAGSLGEARRLLGADASFSAVFLDVHLPDGGMDFPCSRRSAPTDRW